MDKLDLNDFKVETPLPVAEIAQGESEEEPSKDDSAELKTEEEKDGKE